MWRPCRRGQIIVAPRWKLKFEATAYIRDVRTADRAVRKVANRDAKKGRTVPTFFFYYSTHLSRLSLVFSFSFSLPLRADPLISYRDLLRSFLT